MRDPRELEPLAAPRFLLERNGAGENAPVDLRQDDIHGEIGGGEAARRGGPLLLRRAGQHDLQHRRVGRVEHAAAFVERAPKKPSH